MNLKSAIQTIILIFLCFSAFSQAADKVELKLMYDDDQASRSTSNINWELLSKQDKSRVKRVYELISNNKIITGKDYYHSAMLFQHGTDSLDHEMAVIYMRKAIELDSTINKWLLAAAIDRNLMSKGKPQIYGTQYFKKGKFAKWERYNIDSAQVTDQERRKYNVETLAEQKEKIKKMNSLLLNE